jgi:hypothetical protein
MRVVLGRPGSSAPHSSSGSVMTCIVITWKRSSHEAASTYRL